MDRCGRSRDRFAPVLSASCSYGLLGPTCPGSAEGVWFQDTLWRDLLKYKGRSMYVLTFSLLQSQETTPPKPSLRKSNLIQYRSINRIATMFNISFNFRPTDTDLNRHKIFPPFLSLRVKSLCAEHRMERSTTPTWENLSVSSANLE